MNTPEQQTIPGLPKPDRRRELRAAIDFHRKEADAARKEMQVAAMELASWMADNLQSPSRMHIDHGACHQLVDAYIEARMKFIDATKAAGDAADAYSEECRRVRFGEEA